jgi:hypothetical protein
MHATLGLEQQWAEQRARMQELAFEAVLLEHVVIADEDQP